MTLGAAIIQDLSNRQELGMYFDYSEYQTLKTIDQADELTAFLRKKTGSSPKSLAPGDVVDWLRVLELSKSSRFSAAALIFNNLIGGL